MFRRRSRSRRRCCRRGCRVLRISARLIQPTSHSCSCRSCRAPFRHGHWTNMRKRLLRSASPVHLEELGNVIDSVEDDKNASWNNDANGVQRSIILAIQRQPGSNTVEVADAIEKLMPVFREQLPQSINLGVLYDRARSIRDSFNDVRFTMLLSLALVVMVIFVFLRNLPATAIPSL